MRLERIRVICDDEDAEEDIRSVFQRILKDEEWHEAAFRKIDNEICALRVSTLGEESAKIRSIEERSAKK